MHEENSGGGVYGFVYSREGMIVDPFRNGDTIRYDVVI